MADKLKCPFCGAKLKECFVGMTHLTCTNIGCDFASLPLFPKIWQALISGKKAQDALKVAIDALSKIETFNCHGKGAIEIIAGMSSIANRALYEITSITKQEK